MLAKKPKRNRKDQRKQAKIAKQNHDKLTKSAELEHYKKVCAEVDERDQGCCQFPGCEMPGEQHHHIKFRSQGGKDDKENLVLQCGEHHKEGPHSPHQSREWRRFWERWAADKYPEYWRREREINFISQCNWGN